MKKIILILLTLILFSCSTIVQKQETLPTKLMCKSVKDFDYTLSVPDPFPTYCNQVFMPGANYIRESYQFIVNCSGSKFSSKNCTMVEMERFCQDVNGSYVAVAVDEGGPESIHMFISKDHLKNYQKNNKKKRI